MDILKLYVLTDSPVAIRSDSSFLYFPFIFNASCMTFSIFTERNLIIFGNLTMKILSNMQVFFSSDIAQ